MEEFTTTIALNEDDVVIRADGLKGKVFKSLNNLNDYIVLYLFGPLN